MPTVHLIIKGKVQGVFYRAAAKDIANEIGVKGWIKNTAEGNVEALITGSDEQIQSFIKWCRKGSSKAVVTDVIVRKEADEVFENFKVMR